MDIYKIVRKTIRELQPYSSARSEYSDSGSILLDANENSFGSVIEGEYHRYPDPMQKKLKEQIAQLKNISADCIFLGNGSDEAIDLLIRVFCEPGRDKVMIFPPTYGMYQVCAGINNVTVIPVNLKKNFQISSEQVKKSIDSSTKIIFICSPNNPTGNLLAVEDIQTLLSDRQRIIVVDEAYIDFAETRSLLELLPDYNNLVILQTFSKSWGLAGIRLGMALADQDIIGLMNKIKYPYNINLLTQEKALQALQNYHHQKILVKKILKQREWLVSALSKFEIVEHIFPSRANFILVRFKDARLVFRHLWENGVVVRDRSHAIHCENCLRITVGKPGENMNLINLLHKLHR